MVQTFKCGNRWLPLGLAQEYRKNQEDIDKKEVPVKKEKVKKEKVEKEKPKKKEVKVVVNTKKKEEEIKKKGEDLMRKEGEEKKPYEDMTVEELKAECNEANIQYHFAAGKPSLTKLLLSQI